MSAYQQVNSYLNNHYEGMDPKQLILLLFNGALTRLKLAREGIEENDIKKKGENLSKAIAIITELHASLDSKMNDESTQFLRGLYIAILSELPKVTLNNDILTLDRAYGYIAKLRDVWENDVMKAKDSSPKKDKTEKKEEPARMSSYPSEIRDVPVQKGFRAISI